MPFLLLYKHLRKEKIVLFRSFAYIQWRYLEHSITKRLAAQLCVVEVAVEVEVEMTAPHTV